MPQSPDIEAKIRAAAAAKNVDPELALRIAGVESGGKATAQNPRSTAGGLFQVIDDTWSRYGGKPGMKMNADENIRVGTDIIADNAGQLRKAFGREPQGHEVYAAHFFGPTTAKKVLAANPDQPLASLLSQDVLNANPQLKGKTAGQIVQDMQGKMASKAPATAPGGETGPTESEKMMTNALKSGMTAQNLIKDAGPGYKAAMAMMFLADDKPEDDKEDTWKEAQPEQVAETEAPSPLASLDLSYQTPFPGQKAPQVAHLAAGGIPFVPRAVMSGSARDELQGIKGQWDDYSTQATAYNDALNKWKTDVYTPYQAAIDKFNADAAAYNAGPRTSAFTGTAPAAISDFSMAVPTQPGVSQDEYKAKMDTANSALKGRQIALDAVTDPERFNLSIGKFFADGGAVHRAEGSPQEGEVKEPWLPQVSSYSSMTAQDMYPGQQGQYDQQDAARHMLAAGTLARKYGPTAAEMMGKAHEITTSPLRYIGSKLGISQMPPDYEQDLHNNKVGIGLAARSKSQKDLEDLVQQMAEEHRTSQMEGRAWTGKPVRKRAEGSPEEGEMSKPYFGNPNIQRQGQAARALAAMRDVNTLPDPRTYAAVQGFLGTPPDEQGFSVMHPDAAGIRQAGETGFGVGTVAQVAPAVGAVRNLTKGVTQASKALQGLKDIPVGMSTKQVGPIFEHMPTADAPFVGRLDEFVSGINTPVQKGQFLGMLKGKFRDYDIGRAESALQDLPVNAKLDPNELLNRIKSDYDPSTLRTTIVPPEKTGSYYHSMDNPYSGTEEMPGPPLGVIHLSHAPDLAKASTGQLAQDAKMALYRMGADSYSDMPIGTATELLNIVDSGKLPLSEATTQNLRNFASEYSRIAQGRNAVDQARNDMLYPILSPKYRELKDKHSLQLEQQNPNRDYLETAREAGRRTVEDLVQQGNQVLAAHGAPTIKKPTFGHTDSPEMWAIGGDPEAARIGKEISAVFDIARAPYVSEWKALSASSEDLAKAFRKEIAGMEPYSGQHTSLKNPKDPVSFSRFSEHTATIPGLGKAEGIYVNELQSDRLDDLRKMGPKGGSLDKDKVELSKIMDRQNQIDSEVDSAVAQGKSPDKLILEYNSLQKRMKTLEGREQGGTYGLPESFKGMETSPQVTQQLMIKNAISGAIQMGKQFVAFPGAESAQAQLYEKLMPNLKAAAKDLGPGFEIRDVTLRNPQGQDMAHRAIVWGPEAAARIQKKGVPFAKGGSVERNIGDNRRYL